MKLVGTAWTVKCFVIYPGSAFTIQLNESTELKLLFIVFCARTDKIKSLLKIRLCSLPVEPLHTLSVSQWVITVHKRS